MYEWFRNIGPGWQIARMQNDFPHFSFCRHRGAHTWRGTLQPLEASPEYEIKISWRPPKAPRTWVVAPQLHPNAPHLYEEEDRALCLYDPKDPKDQRWTPRRYISQTIVPWTSFWLAFYEYWLQTGEWYGPEAPHTGRPKRGPQ